MADDFHPCPSCPEDFTSADALAAHQQTCRPHVPRPKPKPERTGDKLEALVKKSAKAQELPIKQTSARAVVTGRNAAGRATGTIVSAGELDFTGHVDGQYFTFDAKSTKRTPFRLSLIKPHQATICRNRHSEGAIACFLIELTDLPGGVRYFLVPWPVFEPYWKGSAWTAPSITVTDMVKGSVEVRRRGKLLDLAGALWELHSRRGRKAARR
jgi:penicillin-binding protein-related factor A (putative recombinase)